ncbi:small nuclear ribonucleoprotein sm d2 [Histomonas meleagridis]|uniref:small nuclear ribonucleoprotein sm d2 n=1 Tax=Histomonas meleagridis TaxID=135588 RepID=UPI0035595CFC|nr:small nuclear ribonucleoprotein sm d2 [Histomonas meleagridis]KAH0804193.1 small nuclear ribonucleoprotein sm d2 [Histomonas meleagridis]
MNTAQQPMPPEQQPEDFMQPSEMTNLQKGPMGPLVDAVNTKQPILVQLRSNRKLYGIPKAIDRHWNMILESVLEMWSPNVKDGKPVKIESRKIDRLFLRGDNVISVYPNPTKGPEDMNQQ